MRQLSLSVLEYPTEKKALLRLHEEVLKINGAGAFRAHHKPTMGVVIERFYTEERIEAIVSQKAGAVVITDGLAYSTAASYKSFLSRHLKPKWGAVALADMKPLAVAEWIKSLPLAPKTKGHVRGILHLLFERAMLWELIDAQRNPIDLVKVRGASKRTRPIQVLRPEQIQKLLGLLREPYRAMVTVAICTGMRVSEVLALRWEHIDLKAGALLVQHGVVNGRIGDVKTPASNDYIPLDPAFASVLLELRGSRTAGLLFPSHITGGCYFASEIQKDVLRPAGERIGVFGLGWHCFRHTYRSLLDETGAPVGVQQKLMRHSNVSTTMNIYGLATLQAKALANSKVVQMVMHEKP